MGNTPSGSRHPRLARGVDLRALHFADSVDGLALIQPYHVGACAVSAAAHRAAYGRDGDYWSKPDVETVLDLVYEIVYETAPSRFPSLA